MSKNYRVLCRVRVYKLFPCSHACTYSGDNAMYHRARDNSHSRPFAECTQCGEALVMAKSAELLSDARRARYGWQCWACGHSFQTTINIEPAQAEAA